MQVEEVDETATPLVCDVSGDVEVFEGLPLHVARCSQCDAGVKYRMTASGGGIFILERYGMDVDQSIGLGESAMPVCPNGHGEMRGEDEGLPAHEAISQVAGQIAEQQPLPGVVFQFNFEGAFTELAAKGIEVSQLQRVAEDAAKHAAECRKTWQKAAELYASMAVELDRRRRQKNGEPATDLLDASEREPQTTNLLRCTFEQANPEATCPLCQGGTLPGIETAPRDSERHAEQAVELGKRTQAEDVSDRLSEIGIVFEPRAVLLLSDEQRVELVDWLTEAEAHPEDRAVWMEDKPSAFKSSHIAGLVSTDVDAGVTRQECRTCGETLLILNEGDEPCAPGTLYGSECSGKRKPAEPTHHYTPKRRKGKK